MCLLMRMFTRCSFVLSILLFSAGGFAVSHTPCQLTVRVESDQQSRAAGSHNETRLSQHFYAALRTLLQKANCQLTEVPLPAARAIKMLEDGELSVMVGMSQTTARSKHYYFIGPHHHERMVAVGQSRLAPVVSNLADLLQVPGAISVTEGAYYGEQWQQQLQQDPHLQSRLFYASGNQQKLAMLASGRVIASLEDEAMVDELLQQGELSEGYSKLFVVHENPVYFAFSRAALPEEQYQQLQLLWQQMQHTGEANATRQTH